MAENIDLLIDFDIINLWQHIGNSKSVSQNNICNLDKISAENA